MDDQAHQVLLRVRGDILPAGDCESTLRLLSAEAVAALPEGIDARRIFDDAWEREQVEPTFIGMGMAVPHARVEGLSRAGVYLAFSPSGIPWPHEEAQLIALLIVPWESPELHLQLLARLVRWRRGLTEAEVHALAETHETLLESLDEAFMGI